MKNYILNNKVASFFAIILSVFFVVSAAQAASTISTNIQTDGTLSVTGLSTLGHASSTAFSVSGNAWFPGSGIWNSTGYIGVGRTDPEYSIDVIGSSNDTDSTGIGAVTPLIKLKNTDSTVNNYEGLLFADSSDRIIAAVMGINRGVSTGDLAFITRFGSRQEVMRLTSTGKVGIATTSPVANLQVANGANATTTMEVGSSGQNKGSCLKLYRTDGSAIYAYVAAGATTFTLTTSACASVSNF